MSPWQFWIDVGGTFTDCLARSPEGEVSLCKVLSSGRVKGTVERLEPPRGFVATGLGEYAPGFFRGYRVTGFPAAGGALDLGRVETSDGGLVRLAVDVDAHLVPGTSFELDGEEPAPLLAIRRLLGLGLEDPIGEVEIRLGTTRATNALLERQGARTALITTRGFADILQIGNQNRPRLFDLHIRKPEVLYEKVVELEERLDAGGEVLQALDPQEVRRVLGRLAEAGIESLAVCLLHSYRNPEHEERVATEARSFAFRNVSVSSRLAPVIKLVSRGDTTVADAYLTPIIRDHALAIQEKVPRGRIRFMTSAGGLVETAALTGKDTLFSGPAGGVVGLAQVARDAGFEKAIGFDMGGTSTDVSRYDGEFVYEFETEKAGIRIVAPMLAIETVAAGGGSVCGFDGQKLVVGPRSAGAHPGPACYGRDGPLAVTDCNLFLGRLQARFFPFDLDRAAVKKRLDDVGRSLLEAGHEALSPSELAQGFVRIANANMAAAIKKISVSRGYDLGEYVLVSFGGAAGQHACAIARELDIRRVLIHPYAGVLSAYGLGVADVKKFAARTVLVPWGAETLRELEPLFVEMEERLVREVQDEGVARQNLLPPRRQLDLRYRGQSSTIPVPVLTPETASPGARQDGEDGDEGTLFESLHRQLYGHIFHGRAKEVVSVRVEVTGVMEKPPRRARRETPGQPRPEETARTWFDEEELETGIFSRQRLRPGDEINGPAMIVEATSTTLVDPGWRATLTALGDLLLSDQSHGRGSGEAVEDSSRVNPILLEVFHNHFAAIAEQMGATLQRTSLSVNVKERLDFSCAVFTGDGHLVANAPHMPVHLGAMSETVKQVLADTPTLVPGDVVATNDPLRGGSHLPDITVVTPVFDPSPEAREVLGTRPLFFTASRAHHAEVGGIRPGSMPPDSTNLAEEGVLIRNFKLVEGGEPRFAELGRLLEAPPYPSRAPKENLADLGAQVAANQTGVVQLMDVVRRYGLDTTLAYMGHIQRAAEAKTRASLRRLPDGCHRFSDSLDDGSPIQVLLTIRGEEATVDFTGTAPPLAGNLNANRAIVKAAVIYCFRCLLDEEIPLNDGVLAPIQIVVPPSLLNPPVEDDPRRCVAVVGGNVETSQRVTDVLLAALGLAAASQGTMNNFTFGNDSFGYYETLCGGSGAGRDFDGTDAVHTHMTNTRLTDPEVLEVQYPVRLRRFEIRRGSGGRGRHRGGDGVRREVEFLVPLEVSILSQRRLTAPFGLEGGEAGSPGRNLLLRKGSQDPPSDAGAQVLPPVATFRVAPGDRFVIETPGGGGFGSPERDAVPE